MILADAEAKVIGELNKQGRSIPQQFPNSINPVDMFFVVARNQIRDQLLDPFPIPEYHLNSWSSGNFQLTSGVLHGLATIHRTGPISIIFEQNIARILLSIGAKVGV